LTTLWEKGKADRLLRYADYQALGGIQGILEKKATEIYEKTLTPAEQVVAKRVFLELTELGEGKPDTRRLVPQTDLLGLTTTQTSVEQVIAKLVTEHLIVTDKTAVTVVNIAHDALIEHWTMLRKWLDQSREDLKLQRQINEGAKAWKAGEKALLVGVDLARAEEYLGTHLERVPLLEEGVEFVKASVALRELEAREREQQLRKLGRLQRRNLLVLQASLVIALLLGTLAGWQWRKTKEQLQQTRVQVEVARKNEIAAALAGWQWQKPKEQLQKVQVQLEEAHKNEIAAMVARHESDKYKIQQQTEIARRNEIIAKKKLENIRSYNKVQNVFDDAIYKMVSEYNVITGKSNLEDTMIETLLSVIQTQLTINPKYKNAWFVKGFFLAEQGKLEKAITAYHKQLEIIPNGLNTWNKLGNTLYRQGKLEEAIVAYRKQLEITPKHKWAWNGLGNALSDQSKLEEAIDAYSKQLEINPKHEEARNSLRHIFIVPVECSK